LNIIALEISPCAAIRWIQATLAGCLGFTTSKIDCLHLPSAGLLTLGAESRSDASQPPCSEDDNDAQVCVFDVDGQRAKGSENNIESQSVSSPERRQQPLKINIKRGIWDEEGGIVSWFCQRVGQHDSTEIATAVALAQTSEV
jgi:hypothetical protein